MPLAECGGAVSLFAQNFGNGGGVPVLKPVVAGAIVIEFITAPIPVTCGLRPVSNEARVGEQIAVV